MGKTSEDIGNYKQRTVRGYTFAGLHLGLHL